MNMYELPKREINLRNAENERGIVFSPLPSSLLVNYALWFCNIRWIAIALLATFGILSSIPGVFGFLGLNPHVSWTFFISGILIITNMGYLIHISYMRKTGSFSRILANIWTQIVLDLMLLTVVVHFVGAIETSFPFVYLFHIVLACIFFTDRQSFLVTIGVCFLYVLCVGFEKLFPGISAGIYASPALRDQIDSMSFAVVFNVASTVSIWVVIWYLASHLSEKVHERERELVIANESLKEAQEARTKHLLRVTHELKAPFAAIDANIQLLLKGHFGFFPEGALEVLQRISQRSCKLGHEIQEMLQLANLSSVRKETLVWKEINLTEIIQWAMEQVRQIAEKNGVTFEMDMEQATVMGVEDHMKMLFLNILANAVIYSFEDGQVYVKIRSHESTGPVVTIEDHGIGIPQEKLHKIFDEYYRTDEATKHNRNSTGLGLAIVRNVAQTHDIHVCVTSMPGVKTVFELQFPVVAKMVHDQFQTQEENKHAISIDS